MICTYIHIFRLTTMDKGTMVIILSVPMGIIFSKIFISSFATAMVHSVVLLLVLLFLMPYAALIPMPVIAAILFVVAYNMSEWRKFVEIIKSKNILDILILVLTVTLTVIFDLVVAIVVGLALYYIILGIKKLIEKRKDV